MLYMLMQATTPFKQNVINIFNYSQGCFFLFLAVTSALKAFTEQRWGRPQPGFDFSYEILI